MGGAGRITLHALCPIPTCLGGLVSWRKELPRCFCPSHHLERGWGVAPLSDVINIDSAPICIYLFNYHQ